MTLNIDDIMKVFEYVIIDYSTNANDIGSNNKKRGKFSRLEKLARFFAEQVRNKGTISNNKVQIDLYLEIFAGLYGEQVSSLLRHLKILKDTFDHYSMRIYDTRVIFQLKNYSLRGRYH